MPERVEALVNPALLTWARDSAGYTIEQAAKKAQVKPERLVSWERDEARPSIPQLRKLASAYKRPLAVFYLPEPPWEFSPMRDFRRLPGEVAGRQSPELRQVIRQAHLRREVALDLYRRLEGEPPEFTVTGTLNDDPEVLGEHTRTYLGISYGDQVRWQSDYEALHRWRGACESSGVLVLQATDVDPEEARGFSISETSFPAVILNISDAVPARIFTMLHELTHLMLREGGLCDLDDEQDRPPEELRAEIYCNHVAGAAMVPSGHLLAEPEVARQNNPTGWTDDVITTLARRYRASREVIVRRLLILGRTTAEFYRRKREQYRQEYREREEERAEEERGGFAPRYIVNLSAAGPLFTRLVVDAYNREIITSSDLSDYLDVRLKHLAKIQRAAVTGMR